MFIHIFWIRIGQEVLMEDNLADDEIEIELSPIAVQLAYVQQVKVYFSFKQVLFFQRAGNINLSWMNSFLGVSKMLLKLIQM